MNQGYQESESSSHKYRSDTDLEVVDQASLQWPPPEERASKDFQHQYPTHLERKYAEIIHAFRDVVRAVDNLPGNEWCFLRREQVQLGKVVTVHHRIPSARGPVPCDLALIRFLEQPPQSRARATIEQGRPDNNPVYRGFVTTACSCAGRQLKNSGAEAVGVVSVTMSLRLSPWTQMLDVCT
ncbi:hypothetical protein A0H81_11335 [Grifola frondosa]|uniref:Uncharacterized protein n=1 Tax=Grifola frondosa TaxID=5627 RepID=A0A1C7M1H2_GRIFR|nr:hypothetical protein A0H81_11335 [Grifola frondosa]